MTKLISFALALAITSLLFAADGTNGPVGSAIPDVRDSIAERRAVQAIEVLRGSVRRQDETLDAPVVGVSFLEGKASDADLSELAALKGLKTLCLRDTDVTDAGLKELAALKGLQDLDLSGTKVADAGLKELAALIGLQSQGFQGVKMADF